MGGLYRPIWGLVYRWVADPGFPACSGDAARDGGRLFIINSDISLAAELDNEGPDEVKVRVRVGVARVWGG